MTYPCKARTPALTKMRLRFPWTPSRTSHTPQISAGVASKNRRTDVRTVAGGEVVGPRGQAPAIVLSRDDDQLDSSAARRS